MLLMVLMVRIFGSIFGSIFHSEIFSHSIIVNLISTFRRNQKKYFQCRQIMTNMSSESPDGSCSFECHLVSYTISTADIARYKNSSSNIWLMHDGWDLPYS